MEMPPVTLMVLDAVADDWESVESMSDHGEVAPSGVALVDEALVVDAVRSLVADGLLEVAHVSEGCVALVPRPELQTDNSSLRRYWYRPTTAGDRVWREGHDVLGAYWRRTP